MNGWLAEKTYGEKTYGEKPRPSSPKQRKPQLHMQGGAEQKHRKPCHQGLLDYGRNGELFHPSRELVSQTHSLDASEYRSERWLSHHPIAPRPRNGADLGFLQQE